MNVLTKAASTTSRLLHGLLRKRPGSPASAAARAAEARAVEIPTWYRAHLSAEVKSRLDGGKPAFLYMPWIAEHSDALIARLGGQAGYDLVPFDMLLGVENNTTRREIFRFAQEHPDIYRRMVVRRLVQLRPFISGFIFTFDWTPVSHVIANACEELQIARILIPHESVFVDRNKYYWDPTAKASIPAADVVLSWGALQRNIFVERGYPEQRIKVVGSPKFDAYDHYQPNLTREQFCNLYGLRADRRLILFATQPLDTQLDSSMARGKQREAIADLLDYAKAHDGQLLVRLPPSKDDVLGPELRARLARYPLCGVDEAHCYLVNPEEAVYHADLVASVNSTMLFEAALLGRPALSMKYIEFDQIWEKVGIPFARNRDEMFAQLAVMLDGKWAYPPQGLAWAADMFGVGTFDGRASARIGGYLAALGADAGVLKLRSNGMERLLEHERIDVLGVIAPATFPARHQPHLLELLNARTRVDCGEGTGPLKPLASVDLFVRWGMGDGDALGDQLKPARDLGRKVAVLEQGFIGGPVVSLILDDTTPYYDAREPSRLERWLADGPALSQEEHARARQAIEALVSARRSGSRAEPRAEAAAGPGTILVVDQCQDDPAVPGGLATAASFEAMLREALGRHENCDILLLQPAEASARGPFLTPDKLAPALEAGQIRRVGADVDPFALIEAVDEVFVVSAPLGVDALLAGKRVHCFGVPFYSGWGLTEDRAPLERRARKRGLEDVFHAAYILHARYYDAEAGHPLNIEEAVARSTGA